MTINFLQKIKKALALSACIFLLGCGSTKYVPDGEYLLKENIVKVENKVVSAGSLNPYIRQKINRKGLLNMKFHLWQYNLSGRDSSKWINKKLRSWGEPPVIFDSTLMEFSANNINAYLEEKGYYTSRVRDTVIYKKKKAYVYYLVEPNKPNIIQGIRYNVTDPKIRQIIHNDSSSIKLAPFSLLSYNILEEERERITSLLRNRGYYAFNKSYITFEADTLKHNKYTDLVVNINNHIDEHTKEQVNHSTYRINKIYVHTNHDLLEAISDSLYFKNMDTVYSKGMHIIYKEKPTIKTGVISRVNLLSENNIYNEEEVSKTYNNLSNLNIFKSTTINFKNMKMEEDSTYSMDCFIYLDPLLPQSYKVDFEISTNASDLVGFSPGLTYSHNNLFGGAEMFSLNFKSILQYSFPTAENFKTSSEYSVTSSVRIPKFLMPVSLNFFKTHIPHTQFSTSFLHQNRPNYKRSIASLNMGYMWKGAKEYSYIFNLLDFHMIKLWNLDEDFVANIPDIVLRETYRDHLIIGMSSSIIYNSLLKEKRKGRYPFLYYRLNLESAGNLASAFNFLWDKKDGNYQIAELKYSQFVKADINFVYNVPLQEKNALVARLFFGIGKPYGNTKVLPFEKMYYSGGANSLRGWQVREVGPGSSRSDSLFAFPNQVGDMRLEFNLEYRFHMFWLFEGALFVDAGNIWSINPEEEVEGAKFKFNSFYKEIATSAGLGLRLNFDYFVIRLDLGSKLYDPSRREGDRAIPIKRWLNNKNKSIHIGINYPF